MGCEDWMERGGYNVFLIEIGKLFKCKLDIGHIEVTVQVNIDNRSSPLDGR